MIPMIPRWKAIAPVRVALCGLLVLAACTDAPRGERIEPPAESIAPDRASSGAVARPVVVFLGTSLTAAYGLHPAAGFPARIQRLADSAGLAYDIVNAGVSGETSAAARRRLTWLLRERAPAVLVIETGANDGLRGLDTDSLKANLLAMIAEARAQPQPPKLLLLGVLALPNLGAEYGRRFAAVYRDVSREAGVPLLPFLLVGVAGVDSLNQPDGVHPTAAGQQLVAGTVWKAVEPLLR